MCLQLVKETNSLQATSNYKVHKCLCVCLFVCLCVIKNPEFPEIQTVIILVTLIQNRPKFETLNTWVGANQSIPSV